MHFLPRVVIVMSEGAWGYDKDGNQVHQRTESAPQADYSCAEDHLGTVPRNI